jgi:hypothetical protein
MLHYPKIAGSRDAPAAWCVAFEKYDGTNLHWVWDRDFGWHAFGTRRDRFNVDERGIAEFVARHEHLAHAVDVFRAVWADGLERIFRDNADYAGRQAIEVFGEFLGPNSYAGLHQADDPKEWRLFDVRVDSVGFVPPARFVDHFGELPIARVVYEGRLTGRFAEDVRTGRYGVAEGVICKGANRDGEIWMAKIKTYAYQERLKRSFAERWEDYWE